LCEKSISAARAASLILGNVVVSNEVGTLILRLERLPSSILSDSLTSMFMSYFILPSPDSPLDKAVERISITITVIYNFFVVWYKPHGLKTIILIYPFHMYFPAIFLVFNTIHCATSLIYMSSLRHKKSFRVLPSTLEANEYGTKADFKIVTSLKYAIFLSIIYSFTPIFVVNEEAAFAADMDRKIYVSGKTPGERKDKNDKSGTKKDIKFLRCLSDCKSKCQLPSSNLAVERVDCVQDCQDICCETYEQCSFKIKSM